jgi:hypothetical protein
LKLLSRQDCAYGDHLLLPLFLGTPLAAQWEDLQEGEGGGGGDPRRPKVRLREELQEGGEGWGGDPHERSTAPSFKQQREEEEAIPVRAVRLWDRASKKEKAIPMRAESGRERSNEKEKDEENVIPGRVE